MTDNHPNKPSTQQNTPASTDSKADIKSNHQHSQPQSTSANNLKLANNDGKKPAKADAPQMKMVKIVIADSAYNIFCAVHEEEELRSAVHYINEFALDIKKDAPKLSQEDLLVLSCLNLYEKISDNNKAEADHKEKNTQAEALLNKVISDAQTIL